MTVNLREVTNKTDTFFNTYPQHISNSKKTCIFLTYKICNLVPRFSNLSNEAQISFLTISDLIFTNCKQFIIFPIKGIFFIFALKLPKIKNNSNLPKTRPFSNNNFLIIMIYFLDNFT